MKIPTFIPRGVEKVGRGDQGALTRTGHAIAGVSNSQAQVMNHMASVAKEFIVRKEKMEFDRANTEMATEMKDWKLQYGVKKTYTAQEVEELGLSTKVTTSMTGTDDNGNPVQVARDEIPDYEVYPHALDQKIEGMIKGKGGLITNNIDKTSFTNSMSEYRAEESLRAGLSAAKQQREYEHKTALNNISTAAETGNRQMMNHFVDTGPFTELERKGLREKGEKTVEWSQDTEILITGDYDTMSNRLKFLKSEEYLEGEGSYFAQDKTSGPLNREAAIARFEGAVEAARGKRNRLDLLDIKEQIRALGVGNYEAASTTRARIEALDAPEYDKKVLRNDLLIAGSQGAAFNDRKATSATEDAEHLVTALQRSRDVDWEGHDETQAVLKGTIGAIKEKNDLIRNDALLYSEGIDPNITLLRDQWNAVAPEQQNAKIYLRDKYVNAVDTMYDQLEVPQQYRNYMPKAEVTALTSSLGEADRTEGGALTASTILSDVANKYGRHWPKVYGQLLEQKKISQMHIGMASIQDPQASIDFATAQTYDQKRFQALVPDYKKVSTDLDNKIAIAVEPLQRSLLAGSEQVYGAEQVEAIVRGAKQWLSYRAAKGDTLSQATVNEYLGKMGMDRYDFENTYRVPKRNTATGEDFNTAQISRVAAGMKNRLTRGLDDHEIYMPSMMLDPESSGEEARRVAGQKGYWVTNENETGLVLMYGLGQPVQYMKNGVPTDFEYTFEQLDTDAPLYAPGSQGGIR